MAKLGLQPKSRNFKPFGPTEKIRSLWRKPDAAVACATGRLAALLAFVCQTIGTGVSDVKLLPTAQADTFVEALKSMLDRAKRQAQFKGPRPVRPHRSATTAAARAGEPGGSTSHQGTGSEMK